VAHGGGAPPRQIGCGSEFDREVSRLFGYARAVRAAKPRPILRAGSAGGIRDADGDGERLHEDGEPPQAEALQAVAKSEFDFVHKQKIRPRQATWLKSESSSWFGSGSSYSVHVKSRVT
jgi:hypothetical protein